MLLTGKVYDWLKFIAQVVLPALGTLYFAIAPLWGLDNANEVVGTIVAVDAFLGVLLQLNSQVYNNSDAKFDGTLNVFKSGDKKTFQFDVGDNYDKLDKMDTVLLKVRKQSPMAHKVSERRKRPAKTSTDD